mmetsp:Transcript_10296/g.31481  ORF Transcript_10296/g.31481 Transcript_10296/m.31481 type:complete len:373 (-) Transcript_10296:249-1367(-)|eukprot:CAMPEP_0198735252 /NCGR_PEP_ID=MMETSP1475-20131203/58183_1 /TAXON_ID= ORGANISM="Unidentified sp., Strain CCMP1999" /NCGR_SAMPLE_ID=MMETSP1475 /ASSEMBLY_ACC=CAM_ASM_001111 /LENGTH=372 /DNA_ID=CAMNT_0044498875 /DNA_START=272 /DNA_END=1390 /DNA_ORIENTATION=+
MIGVPTDFELNPLQVLCTALGSLLLVLVLHMGRLMSEGEKSEDHDACLKPLVNRSEPVDEWVLDEEGHCELDESDAEVCERLRRSSCSSGDVEPVAEESEERSSEADEELERARAAIRKAAAEEAEKMLAGDVQSAKDEGAIVRDILFGLRLGGGDDGGSDGQSEQPEDVFSQVVHKFSHIELRGPSKLVEIHTFSNAVLELTNALEALGGWLPVHSFVKNDIINNVRKVNRGCKRVEAETLQEMVSCELEKDVEYLESGREALLWLKRTLQFVRRMLLYCHELPDKSLSDAVTRAYKEALAPCHNWAVRPIFGVCLKAMPNRKTFLERLSKSEMESLMGIKKFLEHSNPVISTIVTFFNELKIEDRVRLEI